MKITTIGSGSWGTALAIVSAVKNESILWCRREDFAKELNKERENKEYLPGVRFPDNLIITSNINDIVDSDIIIFCVPSKYFRETAVIFKNKINKNSILVSATKGFEYPTEKRMSQVLKEEFQDNEVVVISGPSHAEEVARNIPTSITASSTNESKAKIVQEALSTNFLRLYTNDDIIGTEICGAVKNVIAIAAGILRGLGFGDNTMAALITRGLAEIRRLGLKLGAKESTFLGLAGVGDLFVTCNSKLSRNGRTGEMLAKGMTINEILNSTKMVSEGVETVKTVVKFESELNIEMPISRAVYSVIYENKKPLDAMKDLMQRPLKSEYL